MDEKKARESTREKAVMDWINENFESVKVVDFPMFPAGKKIIDQNLDQMIVYWDLTSDSVKFAYPD